MRIAGKPVRDAKTRAVITVTAADVKRGNTKDPAACAAALACARDLDATEARVHIGRTYIRRGDVWTRYITPSSLKAEIVSFDRAHIFMPGVYTLGPCSPAKQTGKRQGTPGTKPKKARIRRARPYHVTVGVRERGANR